MDRLCGGSGSRCRKYPHPALPYLPQLNRAPSYPHSKAHTTKICVSILGLRPFFARYFSGILESSRTPGQNIKYIDDSNGLSDQSKTQKGLSSSSQGSTCYTNDRSIDQQDIEKGYGSTEKIVIGHTKHEMEFSDFSNHAA